MPRKKTYSERFALLMQPDERRMLSELADHDGVNESDVLRIAIRRMHAERIAPKKSTTRKK